MTFNSNKFSNNQMLIERMAEVQQLLALLDPENFEETFDIISNSIFFANDSYFSKFYVIFKKTALSFYCKMPLYIQLLTRLLPFIRKLNIDNLFYIDSDPFAAVMLSDDKTPLTPFDIQTAFDNHLLDKTPENYIYFLPEMGKSILANIEDNYLLSIYEPFIIDFDNDKFEEYRLDAVNQDPLAKAIREDDMNIFLPLFESDEVDADTPINYSIYERGTLVSDYLIRPTAISYAAYYGSEKIFSKLLTNYNGPKNLILPYALMGNNKKIIEIILSSDYDFDSSDFEDCISSLKNDFIESNLAETITFSDAAIFASSVRSMNFELINKYLNKVNINALNENGENLFLSCCRKSFNPSQNILIFENINNVNYFQQDKKGRNVIHDAVLNGQGSVISELIKLPHFDPNVQDENGITPLILAVQNKESDIIDLLLGVDDINVRYFGKSGSVIHEAMENYDKNCLKSLRHPQIDMLKLSPECVHPIDFAIETKNDILFSTLINKWSSEYNKIYNKTGNILPHHLIDKFEENSFALNEALASRKVDFNQENEYNILI